MPVAGCDVITNNGKNLFCVIAEKLEDGLGRDIGMFFF
jgi:hypothetical protein